MHRTTQRTVRSDADIHRNTVNSHKADARSKRGGFLRTFQRMRSDWDSAWAHLINTALSLSAFSAATAPCSCTLHRNLARAVRRRPFALRLHVFPRQHQIGPGEFGISLGSRLVGLLFGEANGAVDLQ